MARSSGGNILARRVVHGQDQEFNYPLVSLKHDNSGTDTLSFTFGGVSHAIKLDEWRNSVRFLC